MTGKKVKVDFLFFAMLCVTTMTDENGMTLFGLAAALLHECAHLTAMKLCGVKVRGIRIRCCGMEINADDNGASLMKRIICASAGVAANMILTLVFFRFKRFAAANLAMGMISALPIKPLDGAAVLKAVTENLWGADRSETICTVCSFVFLVPMAAGALMLTMRSKYNCSLLALCICSLASVFGDMLI